MSRKENVTEGQRKGAKATPARKGASGRPKTKSAAAKKSTASKSYGRDALEGHIPEPVIACTDEQYKEIIEILWNGSSPKGTGALIRENRTIAIILQTEANTGLRIGDVLRLRLDDIIYDGTRYHFYMREHKTGKLRTFTIPDQCYRMLEKYAKAKEIPSDKPLFDMTVRNVQARLSDVCDYLGYKHIGSHSFRKYAATRLYKLSGYDIEMVRKFLQHSSSAVTMRYIGLQDERFEKCLRKMANIIETY